MYCRKCGFELPEDSVFCPSCGQKVIFTNEKITTDKRSAPNQIKRESAKGNRKPHAIYIGIIVILLAVIIVAFLLPFLRLEIYNHFLYPAPSQEQAQELSPSPSAVHEQAQNVVQSSAPTPTHSPKPTKSNFIEGLSDLPLEEQNKILIELIKSLNAENPSENRSTTADNSSEQEGGLPISPELREQYTQTIDEITLHVINGQSDLPIEVQNEVLINYVRSLVK